MKYFNSEYFFLRIFLLICFLHFIKVVKNTCSLSKTILFNELFLVAQRDGLLSIEAHIENPKESTILSENKKFVEEVKKLTHGNLKKPLIVLCRSGKRSTYAANRLAKNGFENVYNLEDGYLFDWKK